jgi:hypothetical protein
MRPQRQCAKEPSLMRFKPLRRARWSHHRKRSSEGFCVSGRCFVVVNAQAVARRGRTLGTHAGDQHQPPPQSIVHVRAQIDAAHGPAWAAPEKHQLRRPIESRPSVGKATGARGARRGDRYRVQSEETAPPWHLVCTAQKRHADGAGRLPQVTLPQLCRN